MTVRTEATQAGPFQHIGLIYRTADEYARGCGAFLEEALSAGEPALVAVPGVNGKLIRDRLGPSAERVVFKDMATAGRNPGRIIPAVLLAFAGAHAGRRVWVIGEPIWKERSALEYPACAAHEALINMAFTGRDAAILCPYDASRLSAQVILDAQHTHPLMRALGHTWDSPSYADPAEAAAMFDWPLPRPPWHAMAFDFDGVGALPAVRDFVAAQAASAGLGAGRTADLLIVVNELATNTAEYTEGLGTVTVWAEDGVLVCQVDDQGRIEDPLAGRIPPGDVAVRGRGLVIVNELADLVRVHRRVSGTSVRLHFYLPTFR